MFQLYGIEKPCKWEDYLYLIEFTYNKGFHVSLAIPFKALHTRCDNHLSWNDPANTFLIGPKILKDMEEWIAKHLNVIEDCQKSYANDHRIEKEFAIEDHMFQRIKPKNTSLMPGNYSKISLRYCGSFKILERNGSFHIGLNYHLVLGCMLYFMLLR
jgi:hypothetical protein